MKCNFVKFMINNGAALFIILIGIALFVYSILCLIIK